MSRSQEDQRGKKKGKKEKKPHNPKKVRKEPLLPQTGSLADPEPGLGQGHSTSEPTMTRARPGWPPTRWERRRGWAGGQGLRTTGAGASQLGMSTASASLGHHHPAGAGNDPCAKKASSSKGTAPTPALPALASLPLFLLFLLSLHLLGCFLLLLQLLVPPFGRLQQVLVPPARPPLP